jgi:hypothetical protein
MRFLFLATWLGLMTLSVVASTGTASSGDQFPYVWVQYADPSGRHVRVVLDQGKSCPSGTAGSKAFKTTQRVAPWMKKSGDLMFKQTVCSASIDAASPATISIDGAAYDLPAIPDVADKIVVVGDTGCRLKGKQNQDCTNAGGEGPTKGWPLATVMEKIAAQKADAILYMGDYHYREEPCLPGSQDNCGGSPWSKDAKGQHWKSWRDDWFNPARSALSTAPWVMLRGNHEDCSRAWRGFQLFFAQGPVGSATDACLEMLPSYQIGLQVESSSQITLAVLDTAMDGQQVTDAKGCKDWGKGVKSLVDDAASSPTNHWLTLHHPVYKWNPAKDPNQGITPSKHPCSHKKMHFKAKNYVQNVLNKAVAKGQAAQGMIFTGHSHLWQWNKPSEAGFSHEMIVGNGGTLLHDPSSFGFPSGQRGIGNTSTTLVYADKQQSWTTMDIVFGYQVMERVAMPSVATANSPWRIEMLDLNDTLKRFCMYGTEPGAAAAVAGSVPWPSTVDPAKVTADLTEAGCYVPPGQIGG